jgi:hypothetical protein
MGDSMGDSMGDALGDTMGEPIDKPTGEPTGLQDQYCSSCNQKKPLIDFGRFLTCSPCRQRNQKANRV